MNEFQLNKLKETAKALKVAERHHDRPVLFRAALTEAGKSLNLALVEQEANRRLRNQKSHECRRLIMRKVKEIHALTAQSLQQSEA